MKTADIIVAGAGVAGLAIAWQLATDGLKVMVVHDRPVGTGASAAAAGVLKPFDGTQTGRKQTLQQQSLWAYPTFIARLHEASGIETGYARTGRLGLYATPNGWAKAVQGAQLAGRNWPLQPAQTPLTPAQAHHLVPHVAVGAAVGAIHCHATATVDPAKLLEALHWACQQAGVLFVQGYVTRAGAGQVALARGAVFSAAHIVLAAGAYTDMLLPQGPHVRPIKRQGLVVSWPGDLVPLTMPVEDGNVYITPRMGADGAPTVYIGSTYEPEAGLDDTPTDNADSLLPFAVALVPALTGAPVLARVAGIQARVAGGGSTLMLREAPHDSTVFVATGQGGVGLCLAPAMAALTAARFTGAGAGVFSPWQGAF